MSDANTTPAPPAKKKSKDSGVKVMVRVRPFNAREKAISLERNEEMRCIVRFEGQHCIVLDKDADYEPDTKYQAFVFDECFWSHNGIGPIPETDLNPASENGFADQDLVYEKGGKEALTSAWEGYNTCIFAYGQSGAGKSFSMLGAPGMPGITPKMIKDLFIHVDEQGVKDPKTIYTINTTFFEIYMEKVKDLFGAGKAAKGEEYSKVVIRQHPLYGIQVQGLEMKEVKTEAECSAAMEHGVGHRALAETKLNSTSSRSHAIFQIHIAVNNVATKTKTVACINLVDLAGSERIGKTGATGQTKEEGMAINQSLSTLRKVMDALVDQSKGKKTLPPYRESMLTWVLKESLGGNSKTVMIVAISPHYDNIEDTISTLRYGLKAKAIVSKLVKQETSSNKQSKELQDKIAELQAQLASGAAAGAMDPEKEKEMQEELQMAQEAQQTVKAEMAAVETKAAELEFQIKAMKKQQFALAFKKAFSGKQMKDEVAKLKHNETELEEKRVALEEEIATVRKDTEQAMAQKVAEQEAERKKAADSIEELRNIAAANKAEHDQRTTEMQSKHVKESQRQAEAAQQAEQQHKQQLVDQHKAHMESMQQQATSNQKSMDDMRDRMQAQIDERSKTLEETQIESERRMKRIEKLEPLIEQLAETREVLEETRQQVQAEKWETDEQRHKVERVTKTHADYVARSEAEVTRLRQKIDDLRRAGEEAREGWKETKRSCLTYELVHAADANIIGSMHNYDDPMSEMRQWLSVHPSSSSPRRAATPRAGSPLRGARAFSPSKALNAQGGARPAGVGDNVPAAPLLGFGPSSAGRGWRDRADARSEQRIAQLIAAQSPRARRHGGSGYPGSAEPPLQQLSVGSVGRVRRQASPPTAPVGAGHIGSYGARVATGATEPAERPAPALYGVARLAAALPPPRS